MVRFLLERGADQEHKTDEMHTALMEASMVSNLTTPFSFSLNKFICALQRCNIASVYCESVFFLCILSVVI